MLMPTNPMVAGLVLVTASPQFPSIVSTQQQGTFTLLTVNTAAIVGRGDCLLHSQFR